MNTFVAKIPGFRTRVVWKCVLAGLAYLMIFGEFANGAIPSALLVLVALLVATNTWGLRDRIPGLKKRQVGRYVGSIGQREAFTLTLVAKREVSTGSTVYEFRDSTGNTMTWFSNDLAVELGGTYQIRATIQRHESFRGVPTTYISGGTMLFDPGGPMPAQPPSTSVTVKYNVVGESYKNPDGSERQRIIQRCRVGDLITLQREPNNPYDSNAVAVVSWHGQIGYISTEDSGAVARRLDSGQQAQCTISGIFGGTRDAPSRGVELGVQ